MTDPFYLEGPAVVSFSGGRSSGYMLRCILDAHGGVLPPDVFVLFTNTGKEREETLRFVDECADRWGVEIAWAERDGSAPAGARFREVTFETASREGEPFAELIGERQFLPNRRMRFCTQALKIEVMRDFMRAQGHRHFTNVVGLRRDEPKRVMDLRAKATSGWDVECPLYDAGRTTLDVFAFWAAQPFDLDLRPWEGNCDACFLKGRRKRERIFRDHPQLAAWWVAQERRVGARFIAHEQGYEETLRRALLPMLPMEVDGEDDLIVCGCTDRKPRPKNRCICGPYKPLGRGRHSLACLFARADEDEGVVLVPDVPPRAARGAHRHGSHWTSLEVSDVG